MSRILLVENNLEDLEFLLEVFREIEERRFIDGWTAPFELTIFSCLEQALGAPLADRHDALLLGIAISDSGGVRGFLRARDALPGLPILALLDAGDHVLALRLIREGAQDWLVKSEIDCNSLARAIRSAIARSRASVSWRTYACLDPLTGLYAHDAFLRLAERDLRISRRLRLRFTILLTAGHQNADHLAMLRTAEQARVLAGDTGIAGRLESGRFAVALLLAGPEAAAGDLLTAGVCFEPDDARSLEDMLAAAERALCENIRSAPAPNMQST